MGRLEGEPLHHGGADWAGWGNGADQRKTAVKVGYKETELGVVQVFSEMANGDTPLSVITGKAVTGAADSTEGAGIRKSAEPEHHAVAADRGEVIGREIGASGFDIGVAELEEREGFDGRIEGQIGSNLEHVDWEERFAKFGAGDAEVGDIDGVDDVVAVGEEGALTEAHDLATEADVDRHIANIESEHAIKIQIVEAVTGVVTGSLGQIALRENAVGELVVAKVKSPSEDGDVVAPIHLEVRGDLEGFRNPTFGEVEITVVGIDRVGVTSVGGAVVARIRVIETVDATDGKGGVETTGQIIPGEGQRGDGRGGKQKRRCPQATGFSLGLHGVWGVGGRGFYLKRSVLGRIGRGKR